MGRTNALLAALNRGEVSRLALGRVDVEKLRLAAEEMVNWVPTTLGPMQFRPGTALVGGIANDAVSVTIPFVYSAADVALIELTNGLMRVIANDVPVMRPAVATTFPPGAMTDLAQWTPALSPSSRALIGGGFMTLAPVGIGASSALYAPMTIANPGVEHALRIGIVEGPVTFRVGSAPRGSDIVADTYLYEGTHSIAFTPTVGTVYIEFEVRGTFYGIVQGATLEAAGELRLPSPWAAAALPQLRWDQSADVVFVACSGQRQYRIERRRFRSWSIVQFRADDGPFQGFSPSEVNIYVANGYGRAVVTSTRDAFKATDLSRLIRVFTPAYNYTFPLGAKDAVTPAIRISGVGRTRDFSYEVAFPPGDTFEAQWTLEISKDGQDTGFATAMTTGATPVAIQGSGPKAVTTYNDGLDNLICWYRLRLTDYVAGAAFCRLTYGGGGRIGILRIVSVDGPRQVTTQVLQAPSSDKAAQDWYLGEWSDTSGWPTAVALYDGRLAFAGGDRLWLSVSDAFSSFADALADGTTVGDSSSIARSIGYGPVAIMNWLLPLTRLLIGTLGSEISVRSSALDAPLTPTGGFALKDCSTLGSARVPAVKCDTRGMFVQRSGQRLIMLGYDVNSQDYAPSDLNRLHPDLNLGNPIVRIAVQRQPNTRIHCIRADGTAAVLIFEPGDEVQAWYRVVMPGGLIEDVAVLPDAIEDRVYYTVNRGGKRYRERFARLDEARGGALSKVADAHVIYQGAATAMIGGLGHLEGQPVVVYADGQDRGTFTVSGGAITLPVAVSQACVGLGYTGRFKSAKLAYAAQGGTALNQIKRVIKLGLVLADTHAQGVRYGQDYDHLDDMPLVENGADIDTGGGYGAYDEPMFSLNGSWDTDARLCITAQAPRPATVMAASLTVETNG